MDNIKYDLRIVPFSRYGSYFGVSRLALEKGRSFLYLRSVRGGADDAELFSLELIHHDKPIPYKETATPSLLSLRSAKGRVDICLASPECVRLRGEGVGLRMVFYKPGGMDYIFCRDGLHWELNARSRCLKLLLTPLAGEVRVNAPWDRTYCKSMAVDLLPETGTGIWEAALEDYESEKTPREYPETFASCVKAVEKDFRRWLAETLTVPTKYSRTRSLAAYINWSCVVHPSGQLKRSAMFMSKNWMTRIWSWDHCFNAMALVPKNPVQAWDQFMAFSGAQNENGSLPDFLTDTSTLWSFVKPPVHGWSLRWMMRRGLRLDRQQLSAAYRFLARWTDWWFQYRDDDQDGIPQYNHGNDSGWDNSTVFNNGVPIEAPDLSAFLIIQMDVLAELAGRLGKTAEKKSWKERADRLLGLLQAHSWRGDRFVAPHSGDHRVDASQSMLLYMPLVLGNRLPQDVLKPLLAGFIRKGVFLTRHGVATEALQSPLYEEDGYWRGPVWAPTTLLLVDALKNIGEKKLARRLAGQFCGLASRQGMAENYGALSGRGLRDRAYTWTSSVFLILAHEYLGR